jgi:hypothetical protein
MTPTAAQYVNAGGRVTAEIAGSLPSYVSDAVFRESLTQQLTMAGFVVETIKIQSGYGVASRDYKATVTMRTLAGMQTSNLIGMVRDACEGARSYTPQVTIPSIGQPSQSGPDAGVIGKTLEQIIGGVGGVAEGLGKAPDNLFRGINVLAIGLVVIVGLVAFGPNIKSVARAAR